MGNYILLKMLSLTLLFGCEALESKKSWIYDMKSVSAKSSNSDLINFNLYIDRVSRGVFALSGEIFLNMDVAEGDENEVEVNFFRKSQGNENYKTLPFQMPRRHYYDAFNTFYKDQIMDSVKDCSNLPYFKDKAPVPIEKKTYVLNKCHISQDGFPNHLESGEYKIVFSGYGEAEWELEFVIEIEPNSE